MRARAEVLLDLANLDAVRDARSAVPELIAEASSPKTVDFDLTVPPSQALDATFSIAKETTEITRAVDATHLAAVDENALVELLSDVPPSDLGAANADLANAAEWYSSESARGEDVDGDRTSRPADGDRRRGERGTLVGDDPDSSLAVVIGDVSAARRSRREDNSRRSVVDDDPHASLHPGVAHPLLDLLAARVDDLDLEACSLPAFLYCLAVARASFEMLEQQTRNGGREINERAAETQDGAG